jgi:transposase-like protein
MAQKKHKPEEIVSKLRQVDVLVSQGRPVAEAIRAIGVTAFTYYRWRKEFGGLKSDQVKRLKDLEKENERLRKAVSDLTLEKLILKEAASGKASKGEGRPRITAFDCEPVIRRRIPALRLAEGRAGDQATPIEKAVLPQT